MKARSSRSESRFWTAIVAGALLTLTSRAARAEESPATRWYGYEGVVTDMIATGLLFEGLATLKLCPWPDPGCDNSTSDVLLVSGTALYGFGGPVSHALRGHWEKAGASFGLRAAPVALGVGLPTTEPRELRAMVWLGGMLVAMIVDDGLLAREEIERAPTVTFVPSFDPKTRNAALSIGGTFR